MSSSRFLDALIPGRGLRIVGGGLFAVGLALPWVQMRLGREQGGTPQKGGDVRPAMRVLPTGTFKMGSPLGEASRDFDETQYPVAIVTPFAISVTEVTQDQYERVMGSNPSTFGGRGDHPVENVSWRDAVEYCNQLSDLEGLERCYVVNGDEVSWPKKQACLGYRLPTEAEWEYAARADSAFVYAGGNDPDRVAWHSRNAGTTTHPVGQRAPNAWGLYDMSGNVWEWVWDWYADGNDGVAQRDPTGPEAGAARVYRGGSFVSMASLRVADRLRSGPSLRFRLLGFRLSRSFPSSL